MKIGKRYWLDACYDISGIYMGTDKKGNYLFGSMNNNYCYLENMDGLVPMNPRCKYEQTNDLITVIHLN